MRVQKIITLKIRQLLASQNVDVDPLLVLNIALGTLVQYKIMDTLAKLLIQTTLVNYNLNKTDLLWLKVAEKCR